MSFSEWLDSLDFRALILSVTAAGLALAALMLLIDRFQRIAQAKPLGENRNWTAPTGTELRLGGVEEGALVALETSAGGGLTLRAPRAMLVNGSPTRRLVWMSDAKGDNKSEVQVTMVGKGGLVALSRSGESETPQLRLRVENAKLAVASGVTVGDLLAVPTTRTVFGQRELEPTGMGFSFVVPAGGTLAIELPAFPDGTPSGVVTWLGGVREELEDSVLPVREVGIANEGAVSPDKAVCATDRRYAWSLLLRPTLFPVPHGQDCTPGSVTARNFSISRDSIGVSLAGSAWLMENGMPTASLWSWAEANPVLSLVINKLLPAAVGLIFGIFTWRRRAAVAQSGTINKAAKKRRVTTRSRSKRVQ